MRSVLRAPLTCVLLALGAMTGVVGSAASAQEPSASAPLTWSTPTTITSDHGQPKDISCVPGGWCVAVDASGQAVIHTRSGWHTPKPVADTPAFLNAVSCTSRTFCVAVAREGAVYEYDGKHWSKPSAALSQGLPDVSCVARADCVAVDDGYSMSRTRSGWHAAKQISSKLDTSAVSCVTARFCVAGLYSPWRDGSFVATFDGHRWSKPHRMAGPQQIQAISCTSRRFCLAGGRNEILRYNGKAWTVAVHHPADAISCLTRAFCATTADDGSVRIRRHDRWTAARVPAPGKVTVAVSCASSSLCVEIQSGGHAATFSGSRWTKPFPDVDPTTGRITDLSCATPTFCVAVDVFGNAIRFDGTHWGVPRPVDGREFGRLHRVSCPTPSFCMALNRHTSTAEFDGHGWHAQATGIAKTIRDDLSCSSATFCVASGRGSAPVQFDGRQWTKTRTVYPHGGVARLFSDASCVSRHFCMGTSASARVLRYDGTQWSRSFVPSEVIHGWLPADVSCSSTRFCVVVTDEKDSYAYSAGQWRSVPWSGADFHRVSCAGATRCVAGLGWWGVAEFDGTSWQDSGVRMDSPTVGVSCAAARFCVAVSRYQVTIGT